MEHFDLIVIGGGPSGYAGAMRAIDFGKRVMIVEKRRIGGAGVYDGVLTSKALWEQALKTDSIREIIPEYEADFKNIAHIVKEAVYERKTQMTLHKQLLQALPNKLFFYEKGHARILEKNLVEVTKEDGSVKRF